MDRVVEGSTDENIFQEGGGILIPMELLGIGYSQATVLEDAQALYFSDIKNFLELRVSAEEITAETFLEIPDVAFCSALLVYLIKALAFLKIYLDLKWVLLVAPLGLLWYLVFLKPPYINGVTR